MPDNNPQPRNNPPNKIVAKYEEISGFSGPIPPPQILQQYNSIIPDAAERIIRMAEKQSDHRMDLERKVVSSNILKSYLGMIVAAVIAIFGLYAAIEISIKGNSPWTAGIVVALDLGGIIYVAISNNLAQKQEREKRRETSSSMPDAAKKN